MSKAKKKKPVVEEDESQILLDDTIEESTSEMPDSTNVPRKRSGELLKETRVEKGFSLEAVHEATKIPMDALKAIEEGYTIRTLSPFYIKGFLKIYAGYLNIDPSEILEEYKQQEPPKETSQEVDSDLEFQIKQTMKKYLTRQRKRQLAALFGILVGLFVLFKVIVWTTQYLHNRPKKEKTVSQKIDKRAAKKEAKKAKEEEKKRAKELERQTKEAERKAKEAQKKAEKEAKKQQAAVIAAPVAQESQPAVSPSQETSTSQPVSTVQSEPELAPFPPIPDVVPNNATPEPAPVVNQAPSKEINLTVRALKKSWLRVKADERTVFQSTLQKGVIETWEADDQIVITGKNIIHLEFELNGKLIGTLGRKNRKAKSVTITKDGLSVTK